MHERNRILDFVRIFLASLVLVSHAPELTDGSSVREPFMRFLHSGTSLGRAGVYFFFILSGYLIVRSWQYDPRLGDFLKKRALRIVPAYVVAFLLSVATCGLLAPGVPHFFHALFQPLWVHPFVLSFFSLDAPHTPPVFPGSSWPVANGSMWTLNYEFRCYLLVALWGVLGLHRRRSTWLVATLGLAIAFPELGWIEAHGWHHLTWVFGFVQDDVRLCLAFFVGGCFFLYREYIPLRASFATVGVVLLAISLATHFAFEFCLVLVGAYVLFFIAQIHLPHRGIYARIPDISYGMYIYGWPVQKLCIWYLHPAPWITFILSLAATAFLGALSWHFLEKPMLALKPRPSVPLPTGSFSQEDAPRLPA